MKKDKNIENLVREFGLEKASEDFTEKVMEKVKARPEKTTYKPLIGRVGRILILASILSLMVISVIFNEPSDQLTEKGFQLYNLDIKLPELPQFDFSIGLLSVIFSIFILVAGDTIIRLRRLF
jgi:hypothetical protein